MITKRTTNFTRRPLFQEFPDLAKLVQPLDLLDLPSPVKEEKELARIWSLASLHVKRDDLTSPIYGGSKTRMMEYFFALAQAQNKTAIASMGPYVSHQLLGIAVFAKLLGYKCLGTLAPQPPNLHIDEFKQLYEEAGIETFRCKRYINIPSAYIRTRFSGSWGNRPFWIPPGGNHAYGVLAIVDAAFEFARQIAEGVLPMPQDVVVPTGTCATAAGLYLGFSILRLPVRIVPVRMVPMAWTSSRKIVKTAKKALKILRMAGYKEEVQWGDMLWVDDHAYPGYGLSNPEADVAMEEVRQYGDFRTEVTYTGKTLAIFKANTLEKRRVVYWNTYSAIEPNFDIIGGKYE